MSEVPTSSHKLKTDIGGVTVVEYGLIAGVIIVLCGVIFVNLGANVENTLDAWHNCFVNTANC